MEIETLVDYMDLLRRYREYSEEQWSASFMDPDPGVVRDFRKWLKDQEPKESRPLKPYEQKFLAEYRRQEQGREAP